VLSWKVNFMNLLAAASHRASKSSTRVRGGQSEGPPRPSPSARSMSRASDDELKTGTKSHAAEVAASAKRSERSCSSSELACGG